MKFSRSHEWVRLEGTVATIGITSQARDELGSIVYIELPLLGETKRKEEMVVVVESTKAAIDIAAPLAGKILEVNSLLKDTPALLNEDPEGMGWLFKMEITDLGEYQDLLSKEQYLESLLT